MKIVRFRYRGKVRWGLIKGQYITPFKDSPFKKFRLTSSKISLDAVTFLSPVSPSKIICVGLNYKDHAKELKMRLPKEPIIFMKPATTVIGHKQPIIYPKGVKRLDYEAELAIVIGKKCKDVAQVNAREYILGYTCLNDVTARDLQKKDGQWTRAKSFDTFSPIGPCIETNLNTSNAKITTYLNGKVKQSSSTDQLIFSPTYLVSFVSKVMTLFPEDIISTGTPAGVGPMKRGNKVEIEIQGIGRLQNYVR